MTKNNSEYSRFHLVNEMNETVEYIKNLNHGSIQEFFGLPAEDLNLMLTGEGSSRIFPAKNSVHRRLSIERGPHIFTESSTDLANKNLRDFIVIGASNSGRTKELVNLFGKLKDSGHEHLYGLTCKHNSLLAKYSKKTAILDVGAEKAVAATKSVIAQALFYDIMLLEWHKNEKTDTRELSVLFEQALNCRVENRIIDSLCKANMIYYAGNNNGVAEELTLKTNEIVRKKSGFLPGTYLLHGVEEVITSSDVIILVDPYPDEFEKIKSIYTNNIEATVVAFSSEATPFHTIKIPETTPFSDPYIKLAAGWNLLIESGIKLGIDLDKTERARKIGNEAEN
ncbi:MAG: SIS domain-containing protein [Bacteroidales bacterium]